MKTHINASIIFSNESLDSRTLPPAHTRIQLEDRRSVILYVLLLLLILFLDSVLLQRFRTSMKYPPNI